MKKLLFLLNTLDGGGAERILTNTANSLADDYDVTVMTVIDKGVFKNQLSGKVKYRSMVRCKNKFIQRMFAYLFSFTLPPKLVHTLFIGSGYDYEIAFLEGVPTKIISASDNTRSVKYAWVHIDLYNMFGIGKAHKSIDEHIECYRKFDKIICVSKSVKDAFVKRFGITDNLEVKYNVTDDEEIKRKARIDVPQSKELRLVFVGRLEKQKGVDRLIKIHKRLIDEGYKYSLIMVGDGGERESVEKYVDENGLGHCTEIVGFTDNPYRYMQSADVLVFPSRAEGYSTVAVEAVILGKPVVTTDCAGMREIFGNSEYGMVVKNEDEAIYEGIKKLFTDKELREEYADRAEQRSEALTKHARIEGLKALFA